MRTRHAHSAIAAAHNGPSDKALAPPPTPRPVIVNTTRAARRLLTRVLTAYQTGQADAFTAKTVAYLVSVFVDVAKQVDLEERVGALEAKQQGGKR